MDETPQDRIKERLYVTAGGKKPPKAVPKSAFVARLRNYLYAGILVAAPIGLTIFAGLFFVDFVDQKIKPLIPPAWNPETYLPISVPGLGLLLLVIFLVLVGMLFAGMLGRWLTTQGERLMARVPVLRWIYSSTKQLAEQVFTKQAKSFQGVALVEYPRYGSWALGFLTGKTLGEVQELTESPVVNVFVPATPIPATGFLLFLPEKEVHLLPISVEQGMKLVISGGIVMPSADQAKNGESAIDIENAKKLVQHQIENMDEAAAKPKRPVWWLKLRNYFLTGLLVTAPIAVTAWLGWEVLNFMGGWLTPLIPQDWNPQAWPVFVIPGIGVAIIVFALLLLGTLVTGYFGGSVLRAGDALVRRVPVLRTIYRVTRQLFETVLTQDSNAFREVVLVEYPRPNSWTLGFVTGSGEAAFTKAAGREVISVFVATTPNPTSGFLLFLPPEEAIVLDMSVEEGFKMVVSGGLITPTGSSDRLMPQANV